MLVYPYILVKLFHLMSKGNDVMGKRRGANFVSKYGRKLSLFMEVMEDIYGKDGVDNLSDTQLIARHRDLAEKILGVPKPEYDPFNERPRIRVLN